MTPADTLLALAGRCEAATGANPKLDAEIAEIIGFGHFYARGNPKWAYTASIDAAMTLIPPEADSGGETWRMEGYSKPGVLAPHVRASAWVAGAARLYAATPALALCAAALRARAALASGVAK